MYRRKAVQDVIFAFLLQVVAVRIIKFLVLVLNRKFWAVKLKVFDLL